MSTRYQAMFQRLALAGDGAFVPFSVLGDPDPERSLQALETMVRAGADALELGIAFSDPLADGPVIQAAAQRALKSGAKPEAAWSMLSALRAGHPQLPLGLLVYANLVENAGLEAFYARAARVGVDSVLVADVPTLEATPYLEVARRHGVCSVLIATPNASEAHLRRIAAGSRGYTYVVTRAGVTGADAEAKTGHAALLERLREFGAPPSLLGFGISRPEHVRAALEAGAAGAICGSAIVELLAKAPERLEGFVRDMKAATRGALLRSADPEVK